MKLRMNGAPLQVPSSRAVPYVHKEGLTLAASRAPSEEPSFMRPPPPSSEMGEVHPAPAPPPAPALPPTALKLLPGVWLSPHPDTPRTSSQSAKPFPIRIA